MKDAWNRVVLSGGFRKFERLPGEVEMLGALAAEWEKAGSFWPLKSIMEAFSQAGVFAIYGLSPSGGARKARSGVAGEMSAFLIFQVVGDFADLLYIFVSGSMRRNGTGRKLLSAWVEAMKQIHDCQRLLLEVRETNFPAQKLYESCGFYRQGVRKSYYSDGEDAVIYRYDLKSDP